MKTKGQYLRDSIDTNTKIEYRNNIITKYLQPDKWLFLQDYLRENTLMMRYNTTDFQNEDVYQDFILNKISNEQYEILDAFYESLDDDGYTENPGNPNNQ